MLKHGEVNLLNVFGLRQLDRCLPHFEKVLFDLRVSEKDIKDWIYENLEGRFYLGDWYDSSGPSLHTPHSLTIQKVAAFEIASEASFFGIFLPNINVNLSWMG